MGTRRRAAAKSRARRAVSGGGIVRVRGRSGLEVTASGSRAADETPSTQARRDLPATASRNQRRIAAIWVRNMASSPAMASNRSTNTTAGPGTATAFSSRSSRPSGLNTSSSDTSWTLAPTRSAAAATISDLPQPVGPASSTPATLGRPQAAGRSSAEVSSESHPVIRSSSVSSPASNASAVVGPSPDTDPSGCSTTSATGPVCAG